MNGYLKIIIVAIILLVISIFNENKYPFVDSLPTERDYFFIYLIRFIHYIVYLMSSFYLFFFNGLGTRVDMFVYLTLIFAIVLGWFIFDSCWLSFFELLFYTIDLETTKTIFHPTFISIYANYTGLFMAISGILYLLTVSIVLYYLKNVPISLKIMYYIIFLFLFFKSSYESRIITKYYSKKNNQLAILEDIYDNEFKEP